MKRTTLRHWVEAAGRVGLGGGVLRKTRPSFFARLLGFEWVSPGDFSESGIARIRGGVIR